MELSFGERVKNLREDAGQIIMRTECRGRHPLLVEIKDFLKNLKTSADFRRSFCMKIQFCLFDRPNK